MSKSKFELMDQLIRAQTRFGWKGPESQTRRLHPKWGRLSPGDNCHQIYSQCSKGVLTYSRNTDLLCAKQCQGTTANKFTPNVCIVQNNDTENVAFPFEIWEVGKGYVTHAFTLSPLPSVQCTRCWKWVKVSNFKLSLLDFLFQYAFHRCLRFAHL